MDLYCCNVLNLTIQWLKTSNSGAIIDGLNSSRWSLYRVVWLEKYQSSNLLFYYLKGYASNFEVNIFQMFKVPTNETSTLH